MRRRFTLIDPFPSDQYALIWKWMNQYPEANFDDGGPKTLPRLAKLLDERVECGETLAGVLDKGSLVGVIGYFETSATAAQFHGICFDNSVHGTGVAAEAVKEVLRRLYARGIESVTAYYFAANARVHRFFEKLGAVPLGNAGTTMQNGVRIGIGMSVFLKGEN